MGIVFTAVYRAYRWGGIGGTGRDCWTDRMSECSFASASVFGLLFCPTIHLCVAVKSKAMPTMDLCHLTHFAFDIAHASTSIHLRTLGNDHHSHKTLNASRPASTAWSVSYMMDGVGVHLCKHMIPLFSIALPLTTYIYIVSYSRLQEGVCALVLCEVDWEFFSIATLQSLCLSLLASPFSGSRQFPDYSLSRPPIIARSYQYDA